MRPRSALGTHSRSAAGPEVGSGRGRAGGGVGFAISSLITVSSLSCLNDTDFSILLLHLAATDTDTYAAPENAHEHT